jgi:alpha-D-xyloside xylohydrolase
MTHIFKIHPHLFIILTALFIFTSLAKAENLRVGGATIAISSSPFSLAQGRKKLLSLPWRGALEKIGDTRVLFKTASGLSVTVDGGDVLAISITSTAPASLSLITPARESFGLIEYPVQGELSNTAIVTSAHQSGSGAPLMFASASAPIIHTRAGWSVLFEDEDSMRFSYEPNRRIKVSTSKKQIRAYVAFGSLSERMQRINRLIPPLYLPPDWAYGVMYWRDDARNHLQGSANAQERILQDLNEITQRQLPISSYLIDRPYGTGSFGWGDFDFNKKQFPDLSALLSKFKELDIKLILWGANIASGTLGEQARLQKLLLRPGRKNANRAVNIFRPEGEALFVDGLKKLPADGWKIDRGDEGEMPARIQAKHAALLPTLFKKASTDPDPFLFARNLSLQGRSAAALWNGDSWATFEGLRYSLVSGLRAGLIFFPFWGSDTGGYNEQPTEELFIRWLQFSSLSPFMEIKLDHSKHTLWDGYGPQLYAELSRSTERHEALRAYVKELMAESRETGMPIMRPLFLHFPKEKQSWLIEDQYLYGKNLLVAPILREGERVRNIYIPSGTWTAVCSGVSFSGPRWIQQETKLLEIPLFVSSDTLLPVLQRFCP